MSLLWNVDDAILTKTFTAVIDRQFKGEVAADDGQADYACTSSPG